MRELNGIPTFLRLTLIFAFIVLDLTASFLRAAPEGLIHLKSGVLFIIALILLWDIFTDIKNTKSR
jgi:multisubunit Na+/H+ antiporter MnhE subunit